MSTIPSGVISSHIKKSNRDVALFALGLVSVWCLIYLVPLEAIFEGRDAPIFGMKMLTRALAPGVSGFPWVSTLFTLAVLAVLLLTLNLVRKGRSPAASDVMSEPLLKKLGEQGVDPVSAIAAFEASMADGTGRQYGAVWVTPNWCFIGGDANRFLDLSDLAWVYFRGSRADKAINAGASLALSASGAVTSRQARAIGDETQGASSVLVVHAMNEPYPVETEADPAHIAGLQDALIQHNPDVIVGWQKSFEALWRGNRPGFRDQARRRLDTLKERGEDGLPIHAP